MYILDFIFMATVAQLQTSKHKCANKVPLSLGPDYEKTTLARAQCSFWVLRVLYFQALKYIEYPLKMREVFQSNTNDVVTWIWFLVELVPTELSSKTYAAGAKYVHSRLQAWFFCNNLVGCFRPLRPETSLQWTVFLLLTTIVKGKWMQI